MLRSALLLFAVLLAAGGAKAAEPPWLTVPKPPPLPKADESGRAPVNGAELFYAIFNKAGGNPVILLHGGIHNHFRRLAKPGVDDLKTGIPQGSGDDLYPPVVAVQTRFGKKNPVFLHSPQR